MYNCLLHIHKLEVKSEATDLWTVCDTLEWFYYLLFIYFFSFTTLTCLPKKLTRNEISLVWMETKFLIINCKRTNIIKIWHSQKTFISQAQQFNYVVDLTLREIFMSVYLFMQLLFPEYVVYCRSFPRSTCTSVILLFVFFLCSSVSWV